MYNITIGKDKVCYPTLEAAIKEQVEFGWELSSKDLLANPLVIRDDMQGKTWAIVSYSPDEKCPEFPILEVWNRETGDIICYKRKDVSTKSYIAERYITWRRGNSIG